MTRRNIQSLFFGALLVAVAFLVFEVFKPYLAILVVAAILAFITQPIYRRFVKLLFGQEIPAAMLTILFSACAILLPLGLLATQVVTEARGMYADLSGNKDIYLDVLNRFLVQYVQPLAPNVDINLQATMQQVVSWVFTHLGNLFSSTLEFLFGIILGCVAFFYFLKDGKLFVQGCISLSPLPDAQDKAILTRLGEAVSSVLKGSLLVAMIQGTLAGIGFAFFGVPNAALWGSIAAICALVPGVGTSLVLIPGIIYLVVTGHEPAAIGLTAWGALAVGLIDNLLGPYIVGKGARLHPVLVLFAVLGGISFFGALGFLFGPLTVSLFAALLDLSKSERLRRGIS
jgi:predicted PurR-regulated permease PerM